MSNRTRSFKYVRVVHKSFVFLAANRMLNHLVVCDLICEAGRVKIYSVSLSLLVFFFCFFLMKGLQIKKIVTIIKLTRIL